MSTEPLTTEQALKIYKIRASATGNSVSPDEADVFIAGYRAAMNEVVQQAKQLKEERDKATRILQCANSVLNISSYAIHPGSPIGNMIKDFLDQLNQNNEG